MTAKKHNPLLNRAFQYLGIILIMGAMGGGYWYWKNAQAGVKLNSIQAVAPTFDAASSSNNGQFQPVAYSWTHTTGNGDNRLLIVNVAGNVSSVTYGGLGLTRLSGTNYAGTYSQMWYLINPPSGSATVQVTLMSTGCSAAGAMTFSGVDQDRPFGTASTNSNGGGGISTTVSSASNELVVDAIAQYVTTPTQNGSQTLRYSERNGNGSCAMLSAGSTKTGSTSTTMQWTEPSGYYSALVAVPIKGVSKDFRIQSSFQDTLEQGLVGYWKLDDASGTSAADASGNGNTGTLTNGPTWTTGQIGGAVNFDGADDRIQLADSVVFDFGGKGSWCNWFYTTTSQSTKFLFSQDVSSGRSNSTYKWGNYLTSSSGTLATYVRIGGTSYAAVGTAFSSGYYNGGWHHVCGTFDRSLASNRLKLYVDGVLSGSSNAADGDVDSGDWPTIGTWDTVGFQGSIDEVRLYGRTLSAEEVAKLYRQTAPDNPDTGLVGYWPFNGPDIAGTTAYDRSGKGNNGTLTNGPTKTIGEVGQALNFDGNNDYISLPSTVPRVSGTFSISAWVNPSTLTPATGGEAYVISDWLASGKNYILRQYNSTIELLVGNGSTSQDASLYAGALSVGKWTHVVAVVNGTSHTLYIDGVNSGQATGSYSGGVTANSMNIGGTNGGTVTALFKGSLDEVRVYNRALSASEIWGLYQAGAADKMNSADSQGDALEKGLVGYWKLDDASGTSATDSSGNANTGTLTNGPTWTTGQIGGATDFDGTNDYIQIPSNAAYDSTVGTWSFWVKVDTIGGTTPDSILFRADPSGSFNGVNMNVNTSFRFGFQVKNGSSIAVQGNDSKITANDGSWHHVVFVWTQISGGTNQLFIDGALSVSAVNSTAWNFNNQAVRLADATDNYWEILDGKLDEIRIYNRALSADEIAKLYKTTAPDNPDTGLIGYWPFNGPDVSGTTAYDRSRVSKNAMLVNGANATIGKLGQGINLDGSNDYISVADDISQHFGTGDFTYSFWVYLNDTSQGVFFSNGTYADGIMFYRYDSGTTYLWIGNANGQSSAWNPPARTWQHVVLCRASGTVYMYANGVQQFTLGLSGNVTDASASGMRIGYGFAGGANVVMSGKIDEFRMYNRALSTTEIAGLYNSGR